MADKPLLFQLSSLVHAKPEEHGDALREALGPNWRKEVHDLLEQGRQEVAIDREWERRARAEVERMEAEGGRPN